MIRVTQGHELGIGTEVFIKSFCLLTACEQEQFIFYTDKSTLEKNLVNIGLNYIIKSSSVEFCGSTLRCHFLSKEGQQSEVSLREALSGITSKDILLTLPTSKDQLQYQGQNFSGYTEYLRNYYKKELSMVFSSGEENVLLVTDHIPLSKVSSTINSELINKKVQLTLDNFKKYFDPIKKVFFSGINPHSGENGMLGHEEKEIEKSISTLSQTYSELVFSGPISGDTLYLSEKAPQNLDVYMFHDQGLSVFKSKNYVKGLNITLGLPFLRMSVDHGTAFDLYGKNKANYIGCHFLLKTSLKVINSRI